MTRSRASWSGGGALGRGVEVLWESECCQLKAIYESFKVTNSIGPESDSDSISKYPLAIFPL
jgi:hypothetical protein